MPSTTKTPSTVYVLGAGFTHAFDPEAPLLLLNPRKVKLHKLLKESESQDARELLSPLVRKHKVNVEEILSHLNAAAPYERAFLTSKRKLLYSFISAEYSRLIRKVRPKSKNTALLTQFARYITDTQAICVTFNYDTMLDKALFETNDWHPDIGYGFPCISAANLLTGERMGSKACETLVLKLHGSVNWHAKSEGNYVAHKRTFKAEDVIHDENWLKELTPKQRSNANLHIDDDALIIPPILDKNSMTAHPLFEIVWSTAFNSLRAAERIVFIGYSLPETDWAARYLFYDSIGKNSPKVGREIIVVSYSEDGKPNNELKENYNKIMSIPGRKFHFKGALDWIEHVLPRLS